MTPDPSTPNRSGGGPDRDAFSAFEAAGWEHQAPTYGDVIGRVTSRFVEPLLDAAGVDRGSRVLDVATGPGYAAAAAADRGGLGSRGGCGPGHDRHRAAATSDGRVPRGVG